MRLLQTDLDGAFVVELDRKEDDRGFFARIWCADEFAALGIDVTFPQANLSRNARRGTLRGMHFSVAPANESKLVRCSSGAIHDVIVDLRRGSPTLYQSFATQLSRLDGKALFVPPGFAHGFLTLEDDTDVMYLMGDRFQPDLHRGARWDDPLFGIDWPFEPEVLSERDASYPDASEQALIL